MKLRRYATPLQWFAGKTLRETVREIFYARELTATTGRPMTAPTLRDILLNPRVRGISTFNPTDPDTGYRLAKNRKIIGKGDWPAIIDEATGEKLDAILHDPSRKHSHSGNAPRYFLASVLTCTCGDPMYSRSRKNSKGEARRFYTCKRTEPGGTHVSIGTEVDDLIEAVIRKRMEQPDVVDALQRALAPEDVSLTEHLQEITGQRNALLAKREQVEDTVLLAKVLIYPHSRVCRRRSTRRSQTSTRPSANLRRALIQIRLLWNSRMGRTSRSGGAVLLLRINVDSLGY